MASLLKEGTQNKLQTNNQAGSIQSSIEMIDTTINRGVTFGKN